MHAFALGVALALSSPALGQEDSAAQDPEQRAITENGHNGTNTGNNDAKNNGNDSSGAANKSYSARGESTETPGAGSNAEKVRDYPDCESDNIAECDLAAQQSMARSTLWMKWAALIGVVLTIVGLFLVGLTVCYTSQAAKHARRANAAAQSAVRVGRDTLKATKDGMSRDFVATHRPRLRLRFVSNIRLPEGAWPTVDLTFGNVGGSDAIIRKMGFNFWLRDPEKPRDKPPDYRHRTVVDQNLEEIRVAAGERTVLRKWAGTNPLDLQDTADIHNLRRVLALIGEIKYVDENGVFRHTGFYREYDPKSEEFVRVEYDRESGGLVRTTRTDHDYEE